MILEIVGPHGPEGWQDEDGVEYFNDRVKTPLGFLGNLKSHIDDPEVVIDQADEVVLIAPAAAEMPGVTIEANPFGFRVFELQGRNGMVRYRIYEDAVQWWDEDKPIADNLAVRVYENWTPEGPPPPRTRNTIETKQMRMQLP